MGDQESSLNQQTEKTISKAELDIILQQIPAKIQHLEGTQDNMNQVQTRK